MQHSMRKSTQFAPRIVPSLNETSAHSVQEGSTAISQSHFVQNVAVYVKVTRLSCSFGCPRGRNEFRQ